MSHKILTTLTLLIALLYPLQGHRDQYFLEEHNQFLEQIGITVYDQYIDQCTQQKPALNLYELLMAQMFVDHSYLKKFNLTPQQYFNQISLLIKETLTDNDLQDIIEIIALNNLAMKFGKVIATEQEPEEDGTIYEGCYLHNKHQAQLHISPLNPNLFKAVLIHEWTHQLMDTLFENSAKPYFKEDTNNYYQFEAIVQNLKLQMKRANKFYLNKHPSQPIPQKVIDHFNLNTKVYTEDHIHAEFIARYIEILSYDEFKNNPQVLKFLKPITNYWNTHITPAMNDLLNELYANIPIHNNLTCSKDTFDSLPSDLLITKVNQDNQAIINNQPSLFWRVLECYKLFFKALTSS